MAPNAAALSALAACNLKELHLKRADGSRILDTLHTTCRAAGLIPHGTPDATPKERYLAIFDAALTGGLGCWILDYVEVVCADRHLTSNDPLEAYLLDGGFVKAWAQACLQRAEQSASSALASDAAFLTFQSGPLQRQLSQIRILTAVLRALDRIRTVAAGGGVPAAHAASAGGPAAASAQDRLSVKSELRTAVLLEQAFQVMDWVARQGLAEQRGGPAGGRFGSHPEWSRAVAARRTRAAPRPLFLDSLLQSLSLSGAYPAASVQHLLQALLLHVRDVEPPAWAAKLALLAYYLQDAGLLDGPAGQHHGPAGHGGAGAPAPGGAAGGGATGGGRLESALEDLRRTFRLGQADVGLWQCHYLLDCAAPDAPGAEDAHLGRACALLPACVNPSTPFAFIEALLALGRPDVALAVDRGQAGSEAAGAAAPAAPAAPGGGGGQPCRSLSQALTLLEVRLRCGLLTEVFMLLRQHAADRTAAAATAREAPSAAAADAVAEAAGHTHVLLRRLAEWAAAADAAAAAEAAAAAASGMDAEGAAMATEAKAHGNRGGGSGRGGGWLNRLTELPLNATEESVLVGWLAEEAEAGRPAGDFLPLFFLQRGRVNEAAAAWQKWEARQSALAAASGSRRAPLLAELVSSALDAAHAALPAPLASVAVPAPAAVAGEAAAAGGCLLPQLAPSQGAVGILAGLTTQSSPDQPVAVLPFHGTQPPPFLTRAVPPPPSSYAAAAAAAPATQPGSSAEAEAETRPAEAASQPSRQQQPAAAAPRPQQPFAAMPLVLPSFAPFRAPPGTTGPDIFGPTGGGGGGAGGLLFSVGAGVVAAAGPGAGAAGPPMSCRNNKRSKPNDWLLG